MPNAPFNQSFQHKHINDIIDLYTQNYLMNAST
jgi:hypothetical protein